MLLPEYDSNWKRVGQLLKESLVGNVQFIVISASSSRKSTGKTGR
jgi:hypothetical protein